MDEPLCPVCRRALRSDPRAKYCGEHHRWRAWWQRTIQRTAEAEQLLLATLPADVDAVLPFGPDRLRVATPLVLLGRAPAGAFGYRVGTRPGQSLILRWFPCARLCSAGMFRLDPFEWPAVPVSGNYVVVYLDRYVRPIGGPQFAIAVDDTLSPIPVESILPCLFSSRHFSRIKLRKDSMGSRPCQSPGHGRSFLASRHAESRRCDAGPNAEIVCAARYIREVLRSRAIPPTLG